MPSHLLYIPHVIAYVIWFALVIAVGAVVGSFLNVCIFRLPLEKSLFWPSSRCGHCLQPIRWADNLPLIGYWKLRGRCRVCQHAFSIRYFVVELVTSLSFVALFYLEVIVNVHSFDERLLWRDRFDWATLSTFVYHAMLLSFLLVATFCDLESRNIPLSLTVSGTVVGLIGAMLFPWPWPYTPAEAQMQPGAWWMQRDNPREGLYAWPVWGPLPDWLPAGSVGLGLATSLAGILVGTLMLRAVRFFFGLGMGAEYMEEPLLDEKNLWFTARWWSWLQRVGGKTLGLGDADLMMMAGSFLGWQPVLAAFFVGVFPGMIFGLVQRILRGENELPFGPALAMGVMITCLCWHWIGPHFQILFFNHYLLLGLAGASCAFMIVAGYCIRILRGAGTDELPGDSPT